MVQADESVVFDILGLTVEVELGDCVHGDLIPLQLDFICARGEVVDVRLNLIAKRGREQHQLAVGR